MEYLTGFGNLLGYDYKRIITLNFFWNIAAVVFCVRDRNWLPK
jgi:hypothetical protein